ncbi:MAG: signal peptidase I [Candidatus Dojkabacteria bacterium]
MDQEKSSYYVQGKSGILSSLAKVSSHKLLNVLQIIVVIGAAIMIFYLFIISPHQVDGVSMQPTFCDGDVYFADKITPKMGGYKYGDVVVFKHDEAHDYIKRVIGVEGDVIRVEGGQVYRNSELLNEKYLPVGRQTLLQPGDQLKEGQNYTVPQGRYMVFGDNRPNSVDSRNFLAIDPSVNTIKGKVFLMVWPLDRAGFFSKNQARPMGECGVSLTN